MVKTVHATVVDKHAFIALIFGGKLLAARYFTEPDHDSGLAFIFRILFRFYIEFRGNFCGRYALYYLADGNPGPREPSPSSDIGRVFLFSISHNGDY